MIIKTSHLNWNGDFLKSSFSIETFQIWILVHRKSTQFSAVRNTHEPHRTVEDIFLLNNIFFVSRTQCWYIVLYNSSFPKCRNHFPKSRRFFFSSSMTEMELKTCFFCFPIGMSSMFCTILRTLLSSSQKSKTMPSNRTILHTCLG